ncbi:MAG: type II toxin-antitoxin system RelE/ParE family toxin [Nitrospirae bacterium]|nr:MAG: type II toxin-antitoxin system RelE/ParE family toxin [Nitrospirota bacterium]
MRNLVFRRYMLPPRAPPCSADPTSVRQIDSSEGLCQDGRVYEIRFARGAEEDLKKLSAFHRGTVLDAVERHLSTDPTRLSRNLKLLMGLVPPWTAEPPVWELRVGDYRVFYDVDEEDQVVYIRAIRKKPAERTTEEIL